MNREILFRAKRVDNGEWVEGGYAERDGKVFIVLLIRFIPDTRDWDAAEYYENHPQYDSVLIEVDSKTICQYAGFTDMNGKRIWENDIVSYLDTYSTENGYAEAWRVGVVFYDSETSSFQVTERLSAESYEVLGGCVVIGNVFDNTELLGVEQ